MKSSKALAIQRVQQLQLDLKLHDDNFAYNRDIDEKIINFVENTNLNEHDYQLFQDLVMDILEEKNSLHQEIDDLGSLATAIWFRKDNENGTKTTNYSSNGD